MNQKLKLTLLLALIGFTLCKVDDPKCLRLEKKYPDEPALCTTCHNSHLSNDWKCDGGIYDGCEVAQSYSYDLVERCIFCKPGHDKYQGCKKVDEQNLIPHCRDYYSDRAENILCTACEQNFEPNVNDRVGDFFKSCVPSNLRGCESQSFLRLNQGVIKMDCNRCDPYHYMENHFDEETKRGYGLCRPKEVLGCIDEPTNLCDGFNSVCDYRIGYAATESGICEKVEAETNREDTKLF